MTANNHKACTKRLYEVKKEALPVSCPPRDTLVWDAHPRVYLDVLQFGKVTCPYCDADYILID